MTLGRVCVYCGATGAAIRRTPRRRGAMGRALAGRGIGLVTGGGRVGLMGVVADAALAAGGQVIGVIPQALMKRELAHTRRRPSSS